jgi:hypothetical protein
LRNALTLRTKTLDQIVFALSSILFAALATLLVARLLDYRHIRRLWKSLQVESTNQVFSLDMVAGLPEPAQRYLLHAIQPGTPLASWVQLKMNGMLRSGPDAPWTPMKAKEILSVPTGFVWKATVARRWKRVRGADYYAQGAARVRFWLWNIIPVVRMEGADTARSALGRLAIEAVWLPSSLLPQAGAKWAEVDEHSARVSLQIGGETTLLTLFVAPDGKLRRAAVSRWSQATEDGEPTYIPFSAEIQEERSFEGYTIPSRVATGWWVQTDRYFEFFRSNVDQAEFH